MEMKLHYRICKHLPAVTIPSQINPASVTDEWNISKEQWRKDPDGEILSTRGKPHPNANCFIIISTRTCLELNSGPAVPRLRPQIAWCSFCETAACTNVSFPTCRHASYVVQRTGSISILLLQKLQNCVRWTSCSSKTTASVSRLLIFLVRQRKNFVTTRTEKCSKEFGLFFYSLSNSVFRWRRELCKIIASGWKKLWMTNAWWVIL